MLVDMREDFKRLFLTQSHFIIENIENASHESYGLLLLSRVIIVEDRQRSSTFILKEWTKQSQHGTCSNERDKVVQKRQE